MDQAIYPPSKACSQSCSRHCPRGARSDLSVPVALRDVGVCDWLEDNPRLVFIIDLDNGHDSATTPIFCNAALRAKHGLLELLFNPERLEARRHPAAQEVAEFHCWTGSRDSTVARNFTLQGTLWTSYVVKSRWKCVSGDKVAIRQLPSDRPIATLAKHSASLIATPANTDEASSPNQNPWTKSTHSTILPYLVHNSLPTFDCTRFPPQIYDDHFEFVRTFDWASTPLGPIESWPLSLRLICNLVLRSPNPTCVLCGPELVALYNKAYTSLAGRLHPDLLGQRVYKPYAGLWDYYASIYQKVWDTGQIIREEASIVYLERNDFLEECYVDLTVLPILGENGAVAGIWAEPSEVTTRIIADRRRTTLVRLNECTTAAPDLNHFWKMTLEALKNDEHDIPFAILYALHDKRTTAETAGISTTSKTCYLQGCIGVPQGHPAAPAVLDFGSSADGFSPMIRALLDTRLPTHYESLPESLTEGLLLRGFGDVPKAAIICPIYPTSSDEILGFLILGQNTRRPYDGDYQIFVQLLSRQLNTALASVVLFEEEKRIQKTAAEQAALHQKILAEELRTQTMQTRRSEMRWSRFIDSAPIGVSIAGSDGRITYANQKILELTGLSLAEMTQPMGWASVVYDEDMGVAEKAWQALTEGIGLSNFELRFKKKWRPPNSHDVEDMQTWLLCSNYPDTMPDGGVDGYITIATSINEQKWAERIHIDRLNDVLEARRQQENFIDLVSHVRLLPPDLAGLY